MNFKIVSLTIRIVITLFFLSTSLAQLFSFHFYLANVADIKSWITPFPYISYLISFIIFLISILLLTGFKTPLVALIAAGVIFLNHIFLMVSNPFYNTFHHSVPLLIFSILLALISDNNIAFFKIGVDTSKFLTFTTIQKRNFCFLIIRLFIGSLFLIQGFNSIFKSGVILFAERLYVESYSNSFLPSSLLWVMGITNPFFEIIGGLLLIVGLKTRWACAALCFFLITIVFGHLVSDPYETGGDISSYGLSNLIFVIIVLLFEGKYNNYSIDRLLNYSSSKLHHP